MIFRTHNVPRNNSPRTRADRHPPDADLVRNGQQQPVTHCPSVPEVVPTPEDEELLLCEEWQLWCELMEKLVRPVDAEQVVERIRKEASAEHRAKRLRTQPVSRWLGWCTASVAVTIAIIVVIVSGKWPAREPQHNQMSLALHGPYQKSDGDHVRSAEPTTSDIEQNHDDSALTQLTQTDSSEQLQPYEEYDQVVPAGQAVDAALARVSWELAAMDHWSEAARMWPVAYQLELLEVELVQSSF